jgi:hypothetical protein
VRWNLREGKVLYVDSIDHTRDVCCVLIQGSLTDGVQRNATEKRVHTE